MLELAPDDEDPAASGWPDGNPLRSGVPDHPAAVNSRLGSSKCGFQISTSPTTAGVLDAPHFVVNRPEHSTPRKGTSCDLAFDPLFSWPHHRPHPDRVRRRRLEIHSDPAADEASSSIGIVGSEPAHDALKEVAAENDISVSTSTSATTTSRTPATKSGDVDMNQRSAHGVPCCYNNNSGDTIAPGRFHRSLPVGYVLQQIRLLDQIKDGDEIAIPNDSIQHRSSPEPAQAGGAGGVHQGHHCPDEGDIDTEKCRFPFAVSAEQTVLSMDSVAASVVNNDFLGRADIGPNALATRMTPETDSRKGLPATCSPPPEPVPDAGQLRRDPCKTSAGRDAAGAEDGEQRARPFRPRWTTGTQGPLEAVPGKT